jgi:predicted nucleotidyltransferase
MQLSERDKTTIANFCRRNNIAYCAVFGSFARGQGRPDSDVDLLVRFDKPVGWKFYGIADELQDLLGRKVDLATDRMLNRHIRGSVLADLEVIYENAE